MSPQRSGPESNRPTNIGEFDDAARQIADNYPVPSDVEPADEAVTEPEVPAVVRRAQAMAERERVSTDAAAFRDPYATQNQRNEDLIESRGEDFAREQGMNNPAVSRESLRAAAKRPSSRRPKTSRPSPAGPVRGEEGQELDDWHPDETAQQLSLFGIAKARKNLRKK